MWNCFIKPFLKTEDKFDQKSRLDSFYDGQADVYDSTRWHLLKGRETMLQLLSAHLKAQPVPQRSVNEAPKPRIWVDIGGGTGWNIEKMDEYLPHTYFDKIYLVDLCEPLLEVARKRFAAKGWKNVHVLCQDASRFVLPEWESGELDPRGSLTAVTLSYSLSMVSLSSVLKLTSDPSLLPAPGPLRPGSRPRARSHWCRRLLHLARPWYQGAGECDPWSLPIWCSTDTTGYWHPVEARLVDFQVVLGVLVRA